MMRWRNKRGLIENIISHFCKTVSADQSTNLQSSRPKYGSYVESSCVQERVTGRFVIQLG